MEAGLTPLPSARFDSENARKRRLEAFYGVAALDGFGAFGRAEIAAAGALRRLCRADPEGPAAARSRRRGACRRRLVMQIDAATRRNLELVRSLRGERHGSLLASDRPHPDRGRRAAAGRASGGARSTDPADDRGAARRGAVLRRPPRSCATRCASALRALPRYRARALSPAQPRPRRPARSRGASRRPRCGRGDRARVLAPSRARCRCRRRLAAAMRRLGEHAR